MAEGKVFAITGFGGGLSVGLQADTPEEFNALVARMRQAVAGDAVLSGIFAPVIGAVAGGAPLPPVVTAPAPDEAQALMNVQQAFPQAQVVSTVGQPLPQPTYAPVAPPAPAATAAPAVPPGVAYPGNCQHGVRTYKDSMARGKSWKRWECAIPWKSGMTKAEKDARCEPINVEG